MSRRPILALAGFLFSLSLATPGLARGFRYVTFPGYYGFAGPNFFDAFHGSLALGYNPTFRGYPPSYFTPNFWNNYDPASDPDYQKAMRLRSPRKRPDMRRRHEPDRRGLSAGA
jgi:hypothetical protein